MWSRLRAMLDAEIQTRNARLDIDPLPVVQGDAALLSGVFGNLLSNALKYGPRSGGDIRVTAARARPAGSSRSRVPALAIPEKGAQRIFERGSAAPASAAPAARASGSRSCATSSSVTAARSA